ncbi:hypothetical protein [Erythrobacter sp. BLCC-B19]|uniref:hypothetical protein n=1 Tax=Erythrobacter sp. BLCC-B19 TaxID=3025315 RepID=UPI00235EAF28|nr:hypothetical protein [Erythrobacter sp. BLCC-B19]WDA40998.1 hypothetical protein PS060_15810 [Erythrobacter sp. BLCC-B19]
MSQITLALRQLPQSERFFRWQATVLAAFSGGSLTAALLNLGAVVALATAKAAFGRANLVRKRTSYHA